MNGKLYVEYSLPDQKLRLWISRHDKKVWISCLKTNFSRIMIHWGYLFDEGKETEQDKETEILTDEEFRKRMDEAMIEKVYAKISRREGNPNASKGKI